MARKPKPPAINVEWARKNFIADKWRRGLLWLWESLVYTEDAEAKGEVSRSVAALYKLSLLRRAPSAGEFPEDRWRHTIRLQGETVEVPAAWIDAIVEAFDKFARSGEDVRFDEAFEISGDGKRKSAQRAIETLTYYLILAQFIQNERITSVSEDGEIISLEAARGRVIGKLEEAKEEQSPDEVDDWASEWDIPSDETLKRAWARWGNLIEMMTASFSHPRE